MRMKETDKVFAMKILHKWEMLKRAEVIYLTPLFSLLGHDSRTVPFREGNLRTKGGPFKKKDRHCRSLFRKNSISTLGPMFFRIVYFLRKLLITLAGFV